MSLPRRVLSSFAACSLLPLPLLAADITWDGGGDGVSWNDALNWSTDTVPGAADRAIFSGAGTVNVNDAITAGFTELVVQSGRVNLRNPANATAAGLITVQTGAGLGAVCAASASGLGTSPVTLNGALLELLPGPPASANVLGETWFTSAVDADFADTMLDPLTTGNTLSLLARTPQVRQTLATGLSFLSDAALGTRSGLGQDRLGGLWQGRLVVGGTSPLPAGPVTFGTRSDDGSVVWVDLDRNGVFDSPTELVVSNKGTHGLLNRVGTVTLAAGAYAFAIAYYERNGGAGVEARFAAGTVAEANYGTMTVINPADAAQLGIFTLETVPSAALANDLTVADGSLVRLAPTLPAVNFRNLVLPGPASVTVDSIETRQDLGFTGSVTLNGAATFTLVGSPDVTLRSIGEGASSALTVTGDGVVYLPTANTQSGLTTVNGGSVEVTANGALGTTAAGTVVNAGGSLRLTGNVVYAAAEPLTLAGAGHALSDAALLSVSGTSDYYGPITLAAAAKIRSAAGNMRVFGRLNVAGQDLELRTDGQIEFQTGGITGAGQITQRGGASAIHFQNADAGTDFSAGLRIFDGTWDARGVNSLGTTAGATVVENNGRLLLRDGRTWAEPVTINGNDNATGAIRSENNLNTLTGPVTLASDAMIFVNDVQLAVTGPVSGPFTLQKAGVGTLILTATNTVSRIDLAGGELRVSGPAALGGTTSLTIDRNETLELATGMTLATGAPLTSLVMNGGAISALAGNSVLDAPVQLGAFAGITLSGAGNLTVTRPFGNGSAAISTPALMHFGFHGPAEAQLDLNNNGGLMNGGNPAGHANFFARVLFTEGPLGRGLDFNDDNDFITSGAIGQADNYANLWLATLTVTAANAGNWTFRNAGDDDRAGIWVDLDRDGVFESTTAGLGTNRGEQLSWEDGGTKTVNLAAGSYLVAFTHLEITGSSGADFRVRSPTMAAEATVKPADPAQAGYWTLAAGVVPQNTLTKLGAGTVTLAADNTHNLGNSVLEGTLVAAAGGALGATNAPTRVISGTLALSGGIHARTGALTLAGTPAPGRTGLLESLAGENALTAAALATEDHSAREVSVTAAAAAGLQIDAPSLDLRAARLAFRGAGAVGFHPDVFSSAPATLTAAVARAWLFNGNVTRLPGELAPSATRDLTTTAHFPNEVDFLNFWGSALSGFNNAANPADPINYAISIQADLTIAGSGNASVKFRTLAADDGNRIRVDLDRDGLFETGAEDPYAQDRTGDFTTATVTFPRGVRVPVLLQQREGGGGARLQPEVSLDDGTTWQRFIPGAMNGATFTTLLSPRPEIVQLGTGSTVLTGNNAHTGLTSAEAGLLVAGSAGALGSPAGETWANGGTIGFSGPFTLPAEVYRLRGPSATNLPYSLVNFSGASVIPAGAQVVAFTNAVDFSVGALAGSLDIQAPVNLAYAKLTVDGTGDTALNGAVTGVGANGGPPPVPFAGPFTFNSIGSPTFNTEGWTVVSGFAGSHLQGTGDLAATAGRSAGDYAHDAAHPTFLLSSPPFRLAGSGDLTWHMLGGDNNGRPLPASRSAVLALANSSNATGVQGVALRRVDTGEYVLAKAATTDNFNGTLSFTAGELAQLNQSLVYTFDFFDSYDGGWGWVDVDDVSIPGLRADVPSAVNRIVKRGSGTLTLGGLLAHDGGTEIEAGLVLANGPVSAAGSGRLTVGDRAVLGGTGVMTNAVLVSSRGIVRPGLSAGTLTAAAMAFTNVSALAEMELSAGGSDRIAVAGALELNGASLHLIRLGGFNPGSGQNITLATAGGVSGTFNGLPEGALTSAQGVEFAISYAGNAVTLTSTGGARVYASPDVLTRPRQGSLVVPASALLANDGIGAGAGPLTLTAVSPSSTGGGTLALNGDAVTYTPGPAGNDSFTYTVSDGLHSATGLVTVVPAARNGIQPVGVAAGLSVLPNGSHRVTFTGTPGVEYAVEWTGDIVTQPVTWVPLGSVVADGAGMIVIDHANPPAGILYYRAVLP